MLAVEISSFGGPDVLRPVERPMPSIREGEVLIRVHAAGVNRPDIIQREGKYPPPEGASDIPGLELAGTVERVGEAANGERRRWAPGDAVCALVAGGGYAEYAAAPARQCLPIPHGLDFVRAAAIPETYFTVWTNLFGRGQLRSGESVLVHGGSSGIGTTAIQLGRAFGATVFATAGSDRKCRACERLGAERGINYRTADFLEAVRTLSGGRGVDVVLDIVGGAYFERNLQVLAPGGRLLQIGLLGGSNAAINLAAVMRRRLTITGSTLRDRTVDEKAAIAREVEQQIWPLLASGIVAPEIYRTVPLRDAAAAHRLLESGEVVGKVVLTT